MSIDIESLGFTKEELQQRVVDQIAAQLMESEGIDEDGEVQSYPSSMQRLLQHKVKEQVEATINALAEKHVLPNVAGYIESLTLQQTNKWGEKTGASITFVEYLVQRAESYMLEKVNFDGKTKEECGNFSFNGTQTRITHLIDKHLHYSIDSAMKNALTVATSAISTGIQETVKTKLGEIASTLKISVATK